ncbi:MAG: STAS domain-containing protein [Bryobacteraceae bacterium]
MSLEIGQREREGIRILDVSGRIIAGEEATQFREAIGELQKDGPALLILNLGEVEYIDSTGLGAIVIASTSVRKNGGNVKLLNINKRTVELLVMTKLATIFEMFSDEQEAVNSFFPGRKIQQFDILNFVQQNKKD